jgi:transglutaminase-like putative cysteine protease
MTLAMRREGAPQRIGRSAHYSNSATIYPIKPRPVRLGRASHVCRDFAHLAVAFCRCMNIPARYCNGYLGDLGVPPDPSPMDFNAWFDVFLGGKWHTFDARHKMPRIGRVLIARGRDAADIPLVNSCGPHVLKSFRVWTEETGSVTTA